MVALATQCEGVRWMVTSQYSPLSKYRHLVKRFYADTYKILQNVHPADMLTLCGDYNGAVGNSVEEDEDQKRIVGKYNPELVTANGKRLIELCRREELSIPQTFIEHKHDGKGVTWTGNIMMKCKPRVYDFIICKQRHRDWHTNVQVMRNWSGIDTPHYAVLATIESARDPSFLPGCKRKTAELGSRKARLKLHTLMSEMNPKKKSKGGPKGGSTNIQQDEGPPCFILVKDLEPVELQQTPPEIVPTPDKITLTPTRAASGDPKSMDVHEGTTTAEGRHPNATGKMDEVEEGHEADRARV